MKIRMVIILGLGATAIAGLTYRSLHPPAPARVESGPVVQTALIETKKKISAEPAPAIPEQPARQPATAAPPKPAGHPAPAAQVNQRAPRRQELEDEFWTRQSARFSSLQNQLDQESNPDMRTRLISNLAQFVRLDTLGTIQWAMTLTDPEERRIALEAINRYALTGIGARIAIDETGFPRIRETTALSAVAATGMVEPGDYIVGMSDENGRQVSFEGMNIQQIIQHLRGQAGSEIQLQIERPGAQDGTTVLEVPVQRSLIVIQPPN